MLGEVQRLLWRLCKPRCNLDREIDHLNNLGGYSHSGLLLRYKKEPMSQTTQMIINKKDNTEQGKRLAGQGPEEFPEVIKTVLI